MAGYRIDMKNTPGKGANRDPKIRLMRGALTRANYKAGAGGPKSDAQKPKPITLPKMPWDQPK